MAEQHTPWRSKARVKQRWSVGAIATPVLLALVAWLWLLPGQRLQADESGPSPDESVTLASQPRDFIINNLGAIVLVTGGVMLLLNGRRPPRKPETVDLSGADLNGADLSGTDFSNVDLSGADLCNANLSDANLNGADLSGADLTQAELSGTDLNGTNLSGATLTNAKLSGANLSQANLRYADLRYADLRYANLCRANLKCANLSGADLNCALLTDANLSDANLSKALLFYINSRDVHNLEPVQLKAEPSPFLCNVALPSYSSQPGVNPNRDCDRIPQLLSARYDIPLKEAQGIVEEARQHRWD